MLPGKRHLPTRSQPAPSGARTLWPWPQHRPAINHMRHRSSRTGPCRARILLRHRRRARICCSSRRLGPLRCRRQEGQPPAHNNQVSQIPCQRVPYRLLDGGQSHLASLPINSGAATTRRQQHIENRSS
jgi:hypothetical protein